VERAGRTAVGARRPAGADIRVTEQLVRLEGGKWLRKEPKTPASLRSITLSLITADLLREHVEHFVGGAPDSLLFATTVGSL
jgi:hypothetical protein